LGTTARAVATGGASNRGGASSRGPGGKTTTATRNTHRRVKRPSSGGDPPNVVVAHVEEGIEILHLHTGRTLCKARSIHWSPYDRVGVVNADP
jgi:hypothetical protein